MIVNTPNSIINTGKSTFVPKVLLKVLLVQKYFLFPYKNLQADKQQQEDFDLS